MSAMRLEVDFRHYWHAGTGRGSGHHLDALVARDAFGLPFLPGKTLRGLLRDAMHRLEQWGSAGIGAGTTQRLFGSTAWEDGDAGPVARDETVPGVLFVSDARLPDDLRRWLGLDENAGLREGLFRDHFSTAMTDQGVAREKSLRGMEVVVPLVLRAELRAIGTPDEPGWKEAVRAALPLIRSAGANRSRGFGRCVVREAQHD